MNRSCMDNVYTLNELVQGRLREGKTTFTFFLDVQKAYDTVWRNGLWFKLWDMGIRGRMWRVIKKMYNVSRSAVLLEGERSDSFGVDQGVAQGCSLSPILFSVFINDLLKVVDEANVGIPLSNGKKLGGMLFADDFVGVSESEEGLQQLIDAVRGYCNKWRLRANVNKSAVMVFSKQAVKSQCKWGEHDLPVVSSYRYLGIDFASNGAWDVHVKKVCVNGRKKVNQLHSVLANRDINVSARRLLLLAVVRPSIEYGGEIWACNKAQAASLESIVLGGAKKILGCSSRTCNEAVRGDMGLETLKSRRDKAKLRWWFKVSSMSEDRLPRQLFRQEWEVKPRRGRQRKTWGRLVDDLFKELALDKEEWSNDIEHRECSLKEFMAYVEDSIDEREDKEFQKGLDSKVKLEMYKTFGRQREFKEYLRGENDAGTRLLFKFRSGTHGLNEELGRHRGREGKTECIICGNECESVTHVLWECPAYRSCREHFSGELQELLGGSGMDFEQLSSEEKTSYVLGTEKWETHFDSLLKLVKEFIVDVWEIRKLKLYGDDACPNHPQSQSLAGDPLPVAGAKGMRVGKLGELYVSYSDVVLHSSTHCPGCVVNGSGAMAAY